MKRYSSRVTRKGQVTIPVEIRRALEVHEGAYVMFEIEEGCPTSATFLTGAAHVNRTAGILSFVGPIDEKAALREYGDEAARKYATLAQE